MDPKIQEQLNEQEIKIEQILKSVKKTESYMKWTFWVTMAVVVLPLVLMMFAIPTLISSVSSLTSVYSL